MVAYIPPSLSASVGFTLRLIKNTGCILFKDTDFEAFCEVRDILKNGWTDEIWETFGELFNERVKHDAGLLESEII